MGNHSPSDAMQMVNKCSFTVSVVQAARCPGLSNISNSWLAGLLMLGCVILVTTNSRLIIENLLKYGLLYNPVAFLKATVPPAGNLPLLCCWPALLVFAGTALAIERLGALRVHFERKVNLEPPSSLWLHDIGSSTAIPLGLSFTT